MEILLPPRGRLTRAEVLGNVLLLEWGDGHRGELPLDLVRRSCPCASCGGAPEKPSGGLKVLGPTRAHELQGVQPVGRYALQFFWRDGHQAGIFSLDLLRSLCRCPACAAAG